MAYDNNGQWTPDWEPGSISTGGQWGPAPTPATGSVNFGSLSKVPGWEYYTDQATGKYYLPSDQYAGMLQGGLRPAGVGNSMVMTGANTAWGPNRQVNISGFPGGDNQGWEFDSDPSGQFTEANTPDDPFWSGMWNTFWEGPGPILASFFGAGALGGTAVGAESLAAGASYGTMAESLAAAGYSAADIAAMTGGAAGATTTAANTAFNLFDPSTWSNPFSSGSNMSGISGSGPMEPGWLELVGEGGQTGLQDLLASSGSIEAGGAGATLASQVADALRAGSSAKTIADWLGISEGAVRAIGGLAGAGLGAYASDKQFDAFIDLVNQFLGFGAPSRARFEASMTPGFDPNSIPGYTGAVDNSMDSMLRKLSTRGNPFDSPGGLIEARKSVVSGTALPALQEYQRQNANVGYGNSMNAAQNFQTGAIGADANFYNSIGGGIANVFNPPKTTAQSMADLWQMFGKNPNG